VGFRSGVEDFRVGEQVGNEVGVGWGADFWELGPLDR
jgi:hypothetical protein